jgi:uncharacterized protein (UPF0548 family)
MVYCMPKRDETTETIHRGRLIRLGEVGLLTLLGGIGVIWYARRWARIPTQFSEVDVPASQASPHVLPTDALFRETPIQLLQHGSGPLYIRSYHVDIANPRLDAESIMRYIIKNLNDFAPGELARFEKTKGEEESIRVGDEFFIHITGPWNGPVCAIEATPTSFSFATLKKHLEAGEIRFRMIEHPDRVDTLRFQIQSWARSSNLMTDVFYRRLGISKFAQAAVWTHFCNKVAEISGGERVGDIQVMTHRVSAAQARQHIPMWKQYTPHFERWRKANLNFDITKTEEFTEKNGWRIDEYGIGLPSEPPGEPIPGGSWELAKEIIGNYEFPDPLLITGIFAPDIPIKDRIMVLRARFLFFTFLFGVKINKVIDEVRQTEKGESIRVWGFSYQTLEGHFEMGEITFEAVKYLESGRVEFRVHAYSKPDFIRNPFYRIGFKLFGRSLQVRFARTATARMQQLVLSRMTKPEETPEDVKTIETPEVRPIEDSTTVQEKVESLEEKLEEKAAESEASAPPPSVTA